MSKGLPDTLDEFIYNADRAELLERVEEKYSAEVREKVREFYGSEVPEADLDRQLEWLESKFYSFIDGFREEKFAHPALNDIYSSLLPQEESSHVQPQHIVEPAGGFRNYDAVVLDHCAVFEVLSRSSNQYFSNDIVCHDWEETLQTIDDAAQTSEVYVLSDMVEKTNREKFLGQIEAAKLFVDNFETIDLEREIEVPENLEHMREDLMIGARSEELGEDVLVLTYDPDFFRNVSNRYGIEAATPHRL